MSTPKTVPTTASVDAFLASVADPQRQQDTRDLVTLLETVAGAKAKMWGEGMIGCGTYQMGYANGRSAEWMLVALAPRRDRITLYVAPGFDGHEQLLSSLGTYKAGKGCIHIKRLADIDVPTLTRLVAASIAHLRARHP